MLNVLFYAPTPEGAEIDCPDCGDTAIITNDGVFCPTCGSN